MVEKMGGFGLFGVVFKGRLDRNKHQKPTFHPLGDFLNPALALLGQGLKKSPIEQKLDFANHPYLCKGLSIMRRYFYLSLTSTKKDI